MSNPHIPLDPRDADPLAVLEDDRGRRLELEFAYRRGFDDADASRGSSLLALLTGLVLGALVTLAGLVAIGAVWR